MRSFLAALAALVGLAVAGAGLASPVRTQHLTADLVAETTGAAPGSTIWVALAQDIDKGWHTYWRNPGDAGEPTRIAWTLPAGWRAGEIVWPAPGRFLLGKPPNALMNYVYEGRILLPVPIEVPVSARPGETYRLKAAAAFLVCADVCIPADAVVELTLPIVAGAPAADPRWGQEISSTLAHTPRPAGLIAAFQPAPDALKIAFVGPALKGAKGADAYFYPYDDKLIDHAHPQAVERGPNGLTLTIAPGYAFTHGAAPTQAVGVLSVDGKAYEVTAKAGPPPAGATGLGPPLISKSLGLPLAMVLAFLGGLILNLMPCVFPVLSMKAASFAGHAHEAKAARAQGLAFLAGVLITFLALAGVLIGARAGGEAVGWGFQLQSPMIVAALALLMLLAALNLSGLYELGLSVQGAGDSLASRGGLIGAAFTGALAVIVAAPCTAPFMAPALGYALTQPPAAALSVFLALGLGFAAPFTGLSFAPPLIRRFPKPGPWMDVLRKVLAFPMYGAAAWLAWVLEQQAGSDGLARILAAAVALALGAWLLGRSQRRMAEGRSSLLMRTAALLIVGVAAALALAAPYAPATRSTSASVSPVGEVPQLPYTPERLAALRAEKRPVFVNFTAAWCVTCQVNEKAALSSPEVAAAFDRTGAVYLVGDWTNRNTMIAQALAEQGRVGVPLYLVYGADGGAPSILPQLLSPAMVVEALDAAKGGPGG